MAYSNDYWNQNQVPNSTYYDTEMEYTNLQNQGLEFQSFGDDASKAYYAQQAGNQAYTEIPQEQYPHMFTPMYTEETTNEKDEYEFDEKPLLEELEIYPDRIMEKTLAVLNPFRSHSLADDADFLTKQTDLGGPLVYCLLFGTCLFLSGSKAPFGYIYGLSMVSCVLMYALLTLMTPKSGIFSLTGVGSILGYCLLPIVSLSFLGMFLSLRGAFGISGAVLVVLWSSLSASRLFVAMSGDNEQRPLIAYPCALVYGVFSLLVVF